MSSRLAAEALCAVTGLWPRESPTIETLLAAEGIVERWRGRLAKWMKGKQAPMTWEPAPDQVELQGRIVDPLNAAEVEAWLGALGDPEVGLDYAAVLLSARELLNDKWPKLDIGTVVPDVLPLAHDDLAEVWSLVRVLDGPDSLFDDLDAWVLTPSQVEAWNAVYPELSAMVRDLLTGAMIDHATAGGAFSWQQLDLVRMVRGLPPEAQLDVGLAPDKQPEPPPPDAFKIDFRATRTASEQATFRQSAR